MEFVDLIVSDEYDGLKITILDTMQGKIDGITLRFSDYFNRGNAIRRDYARFSWYGTPSETDILALGKAVRDYIAVFE